MLSDLALLRTDDNEKQLQEVMALCRNVRDFKSSIHYMQRYVLVLKKLMPPKKKGAHAKSKIIGD